jgi:hypothetical protein
VRLAPVFAQLFDVAQISDNATVQEDAEGLVSSTTQGVSGVDNLQSPGAITTCVASATTTLVPGASSVINCGRGQLGTAQPNTTISFGALTTVINHEGVVHSDNPNTAEMAAMSAAARPTSTLVSGTRNAINNNCEQLREHTLVSGRSSITLVIPRGSSISDTNGDGTNYASCQIRSGNRSNSIGGAMQRVVEAACSAATQDDSAMIGGPNLMYVKNIATGERVPSRQFATSGQPVPSDRLATAGQQVALVHQATSEQCFAYKPQVTSGQHVIAEQGVRSRKQFLHVAESGAALIADQGGFYESTAPNNVSLVPLKNHNAGADQLISMPSSCVTTTAWSTTSSTLFPETHYSARGTAEASSEYTSNGPTRSGEFIAAASTKSYFENSIADASPPLHPADAFLQSLPTTYPTEDVEPCPVPLLSPAVNVCQEKQQQQQQQEGDTSNVSFCNLTSVSVDQSGFFAQSHPAPVCAFQRPALRFPDGEKPLPPVDSCFRRGIPADSAEMLSSG